MKFIDPCLPHKRSSADDTQNSNSTDIEPTQETVARFGDCVCC